MVISSETLFHFTKSANNLINILTNEFRPKFCYEDKKLLFPELLEKEAYAIPMVCFCDLPLSNVNEHLQFYGNYGIGLSKEWGIKNGLNPVLYLAPESLFIKLFRILIVDTIVENRTSDSGIAVELIDYTKPYEGKMHRKGDVIEKRFYDEREWRYIPNLREIEKHPNQDYRLIKSEFFDSVKRAQANNELSEIAKLSFNPDDIKYIIVEKENEILSMIKALRRIKEKYNKDTVDKLLTRIISAEQIKSDF